MSRYISEQTILGLAILGLAGIGPVIFPAAQAGFATMSFLGTHVLLPSLALLAGLVGVAARRGHRPLTRRLLMGAVSGTVATLGLEVVRIISFRLGGMPGDLPRLMGVLLTDRFMYGPSTVSDLLGWAYHFWNGAVFGLAFVLLLGRRPLGWYVTYGVLIGVGFLASPVVASMGVGTFGVNMPSMPLTVILAHVAYGLALGSLHRRWSLPAQSKPEIDVPLAVVKGRSTIPEPDPKGEPCA